MDHLAERSRCSRSTLHRLENADLPPNATQPVSDDKLVAVLLHLPGVDDDLADKLGTTWTTSEAREELAFRSRLASSSASARANGEPGATSQTIIFATPHGDPRYRLVLTPIHHDDVDELDLLSERTRHVFGELGLTSTVRCGSCRRQSPRTR
jgi:hypothetical protein